MQPLRDRAARRGRAQLAAGRGGLALASPSPPSSPPRRWASTGCSPRAPTSSRPSRRSGSSAPCCRRASCAWCGAIRACCASASRFSLPVMLILLCHELGHYLFCRRYRIDATLPFFLPAPFAIGTFGAFIRIRSRIRDKRQLFDVGIAGPIAGFAVLVPFLLYGIAHSLPTPVVLAEPGRPAHGAAAARAPACSPCWSRGWCTGRCRRAWCSTRTRSRSRPGSASSPPASTCCRWRSSTAATSSTRSPAARQWRLAMPLWLALVAAGFFCPGWLAVGGDRAAHRPAAPAGGRRERPLDARPHGAWRCWRWRCSCSASCRCRCDAARHAALRAASAGPCAARRQLEHEGHRPVVDQLHLHVGAEPPGGHRRAPRRAAPRPAPRSAARPPRAAPRASNDGRRPRASEPARVNCETTRKAPPTSAAARFIRPSASSKTRSPASLRAARQPLLGAVAALDADQRQQAAADGADLLAGDGDPGAADALDDESHGVASIAPSPLMETTAEGRGHVLSPPSARHD